MALCRNSRSRILTSSGKLEEFEIKVGVHQGSALSPLLLITVMEEAGKTRRQKRDSGNYFADDLVIAAEKEEEVTEGLREWKRALELRGLKVNLGKTKAMILGEESSIKVKRGKWLCGVCGDGVGRNSLQCSSCSY